ncbi:hypothetical protein ACH5RR_018810 [Cinchona calisaya]|uniref:Uncharacterized protein n=1 Tax=Cinchona calisaya TaxID=153742 RepID=A0ABD2ZP66_9GENT
MMRSSIAKLSPLSDIQGTISQATTASWSTELTPSATNMAEQLAVTPPSITIGQCFAEATSISTAAASEHANSVDVTHNLSVACGSSTARQNFSIVKQGALVIVEPIVDTKGTILCLSVQTQEKDDMVGCGKKAISHGKGKFSKVVCSASNLNSIES